MESINKNNFVEIPTECSNPVSLVQHNVQQRHRFNSKQKHPFMLSLETLFSLVHQNKPKMFPSSFFFLTIYFAFPILLFIIFKCILYAIRFLCEVNPDEQRKLHAHNSQPSCNYTTYGEWERGTDRQTILMYDSVLTDNLHFSRTATNQPPNSLNTKNSTQHRVLTLLCTSVVMNCSYQNTYIFIAASWIIIRSQVKS